MTAETSEPGAPPYRVDVERAEQGWEVRIVDIGPGGGGPGGGGDRIVSVRPCSGETEARTFASTVIQHLGWLSPEKFREYYRL